MTITKATTPPIPPRDGERGRLCAETVVLSPFRPLVMHLTARAESALAGAEKGCRSEKRYCFDHGSVHGYARLSTIIRQSYVLLSACGEPRRPCRDCTRG